MIDEESLDFDPIGNEVEAVSPSSKVRINIHIHRSLHTEVLELAKAEDETLSTVVKRALKEHVRKYKRSKT